MSAFLGPIHNWLYGKILLQNELIDEILEFANREGWMNETVNVHRYGELEKGELADIVDESNIHGWLQERVNLVEQKLAYLVTVFVIEDENRIRCIGNLAYKVGEKHQVGPEADVRAVYDHLEAMLLNGMPCDHVNEVIAQDSESISWRQRMDIHKQYWDIVGGDVANYYFIRENFIAGILTASPYQLIVEEDTYQVSR